MSKLLMIQRADPYVLHHGGKYYFTASVPEYDRIELRCADTIEALASSKPVNVWHKHESGLMSKHVWAPEIHNIKGGWYIYFAAGEADDIWKIRPYVLKCTGSGPMKDKWEECGAMKKNDGDPFTFSNFSLDATIFEHNGRHYHIWAEKVSGQHGISNIYIGELDTPTRLKTVQVLLSTPDYDWERVGFWVNEGPAVLKHKEKIYITFSASATGACYCIGLLEADINSDLLDPQSWKKSRRPVLSSNYELGLYGPGHNSFTVDENGNPIMVFHARFYDNIEGDPLYDPNRHVMVMPVRFDENDYPVFNWGKPEIPEKLRSYTPVQESTSI